MEMKSLDLLVRAVYPDVKILQVKKLAKMKLSMSRTGAFSWQKFKSVDMVETEHSFFFDPREGLIRGQKRQLAVWSVLLLLSVILVIIGLFPAMIVLIISLLGVIVCPINLALFRKPKRIVMIWKNRIQKNAADGEEHLLQGFLLKGDSFSIVADMKEIGDSGTIGYNADFTIRYTA